MLILHTGTSKVLMISCRGQPEVMIRIGTALTNHNKSETRLQRTCRNGRKAMQAIAQSGRDTYSRYCVLYTNSQQVDALGLSAQSNAVSLASRGTDRIVDFCLSCKQSVNADSRTHQDSPPAHHHLPPQMHFPRAPEQCVSRSLSFRSSASTNERSKRDQGNIHV